jgi:hypothetical protein
MAGLILREHQPANSDCQRATAEPLKTAATTFFISFLL